MKKETVARVKLKYIFCKGRKDFFKLLFEQKWKQTEREKEREADKQINTEREQINRERKMQINK